MTPSAVKPGFPSTTHSDIVSKCVVSGSGVTLTLAKAGSNFMVALMGSGAWLANDANKVTGQVNNFGTKVQDTDSNTTNQYSMATGSAAGSNSNLVNKTNTPTVGAVVLTRTLTNVMDIGMLNFEIEVKEQELNADSCVCLSVPTYYNPTVGGMPRCAYWDATAGADLETVFC